MIFRRDLTHFGSFVKKHLDVFDRRVFVKLAVLTAILFAVVVILALLF